MLFFFLFVHQPTTLQFKNNRGISIFILATNLEKCFVKELLDAMACEIA